ncbi:MAG: hypothetical protein U0840_00270 [Gemmataceae bacterium]
MHRLFLPYSWLFRLLVAGSLLGQGVGMTGIPISTRNPANPDEELPVVAVRLCGCVVGDPSQGCCCSGGCCSTASPESAQPTEDDPELPGMTGIRAARCKAETPGWLLLSVSGLPSSALAAPLAAASSDSIEVQSETAFRLVPVQPTPPPRSSLV